MNYRPVLFIFDVISTFLMLLFLTFETKMQLIQCVPCLVLSLGTVGLRIEVKVIIIHSILERGRGVAGS